MKKLYNKTAHNSKSLSPSHKNKISEFRTSSNNVTVENSDKRPRNVSYTLTSGTINDSFN